MTLLLVKLLNFNKSMKNIGIVGSGIGGIATAIRLRVQGFKVDIFEANAYPGGKLSEIIDGEFRFDAGPSLFTMPEYVTELFELAGKDPSTYFQYKKLDEICRYFWDDGTHISVPSDLTSFDNLISEKFNEKKGAVVEYLKDSGIKYKTLNGLFLEDSLHKLSTWTSRRALKGYLNLHKLGIFGTLHEHNSKFFKHPKVVQLFDRYATYNGSDPYQTPGTMGIIPHLEYNVGAFFPINGMHSITQSLFNLSKDLGVNYYFNHKVSKIIIEDRKATGIIANGKTFGNYDNVVSNMDITPTYRKLMPDLAAPNKILNQEKSGSGLIFYWGMSHKFNELGLHNIFFSNNYKEEFKSQFTEKNINNDPTIYINITSKHNKSDAPDGCENWFVLINAPNNEGQEWDEIIQRTKLNIIRKLSNILKKDISKFIVSESILDPRTIELKTSSAQGALYGNSSNGKFAAFMRHPNFSKNIDNLYFVGGSVHPGGGIPLALSSAKITVNLMA